MPNDNLQESLQALPPMLNHIITEPIRKYLSRQGRNGHASSLPLENVTEVFKIGVAAPHSTVLEFEGGDVCSAYNLIVGIHISRRPMRHRVFDLTRKTFFFLLVANVGRVWGMGLRNEREDVGIPLLLGNSLAAHRFLRSFAAAHQAWLA